MIKILLRGRVPETISKLMCETLWKCVDGPQLPGLSVPPFIQTSALSLPAPPCSKVKGLIYEWFSGFTEAVSHPLPPTPPHTMLPHWFGRSVALVKQLGLTSGLLQAALTSAFRRNSGCRWHSWKAVRVTCRGCQETLSNSRKSKERHFGTPTSKWKPQFLSLHPGSKDEKTKSLQRSECPRLEQVSCSQH